MPFGTHMFHALQHRNDIQSDNDNGGDGDGGGGGDDDDANTKQLKNCYPCTMRNNDLLVCDLPDVSGCILSERIFTFSRLYAGKIYGSSKYMVGNEI